MGATIRLGTRRARVPRSRAARGMAALTAAGVNLLHTYEATTGGQAMRHFLELADGLPESTSNWWPTDTPALEGEGLAYRDGDEHVYKLADGTVVYSHAGHGEIRIRVAASSVKSCLAVVQQFRDAYPATYITETDDPKVPITFWSLGSYGPERRLRRIDASPWEDIERNYTATVRDELAGLMYDFEPGKSGQLMLWQGPPGTGKTWALRALASEWSQWAEFHYITDPDAFFVESASYLVEVLLADSYTAIDPDGDVYSEQDELGKWRVLILEDTGELLSAHAKEKYGQGLSRLLNVVDGMIGQGLRVLVVVTTNDELGDLNPAVMRPGRCASQIVFAPMTAEEIAEWGADTDGPATIAELYAGRGTEAIQDDDPEAADLVASAEDQAANDLRAAIFQVAESHQEHAVGYGETAWLEDECAVLYVSGDWTDPVEDGIEADFLAIDGVDAFRHEAEGLPDGWWDAEVVYPEDPPRWVTVPPEEAALANALELARQPLVVVPEPDAPVLAAADVSPRSTLTAALDALTAAHTRTVDGVRALFERDGADIHARMERDAEHSLVASAIDALRNVASAPAPDVHVHLPEQAPPNLNVHVDAPEIQIPAPAPIHVHVPEQAAPSLFFDVPAPAPAPAPDVHVHLPDVSPHIDVHVPEQAPAPVHVSLAQPTPRPSAVRVEFDNDGRKVFVPVDEEEVVL